MDLTRNEKISKLREAQGYLFDAIELVEEVFPDDKEVQSYFIDHLVIYASDEHGFLTSDPNIDKLIEQVKKEYPRKTKRRKGKRKKK